LSQQWKLPESARAVLFDGEPDFQGAEAAGEFGAVIAGPEVAAGEAARELLRMGGARDIAVTVEIAVTDENAAGIVLDVHPLVEGRRRGSRHVR